MSAMRRCATHSRHELSSARGLVLRLPTRVHSLRQPNPKRARTEDRPATAWPPSRWLCWLLSFLAIHLYYRFSQLMLHDEVSRKNPRSMMGPVPLPRAHDDQMSTGRSTRALVAHMARTADSSMVPHSRSGRSGVKGQWLSSGEVHRRQLRERAIDLSCFIVCLRTPDCACVGQAWGAASRPRASECRQIADFGL